MSLDEIVYLMNSTTAPLDPRVREQMSPLLVEDPREGGFLSDGRVMGRILDQARQEVASFLGARPEEVIFTSGGTESCNLALKGIALPRLARAGGRMGIGVAATEHTAVLYPARSLGKLGFDIREVPVDAQGRLRLDELERWLEERPLLLSVAMATSETGTLQPMQEIASKVHAAGALLHTDACLAAAHRRLDVKALGVDLVSISAHKLRGPRGVGALYVRDGIRLMPLIEGGTNEGGRRGGSEYLAGIAGLGCAARLIQSELDRFEPRIEKLGRRLREALQGIAGVRFHGHPDQRLHSMVSLSVPGLDGEALLMKLAQKGYAASSGSSCFDEAGKASHVLMAMGVDRRLAQSSLLFSLGPLNTEEEVDGLAREMSSIIKALRALSPDAS